MLYFPSEGGRYCDKIPYIWTCVLWATTSSLYRASVCRSAWW